MAFVLTLSAVIVGLVAFLAVPVDVRFSIDCRKTWGVRASVRWLFGLVRLWKNTPSAGEKHERPAAGHKGDGRRDKQRKKRKVPWRRVRAALRSPGFLGRGLRFAADAATVLRVRSLRGTARIGLDDPADTGLLWAVLGPLHAGIATVPVADIHIEPVFAGTTFAARGTGEVRVIPGRLLFAAIAFVTSPVTLRAAWAAARP